MSFTTVNCQECQTPFIPRTHNQKSCTEACYRTYYNKNIDPLRCPSRTPEGRRAKNLQRLYKLTVKEFDRILEEQDGACAICGEDEPTKKGWAVDHDHGCCPGAVTCGNCIRGILCSRCNQALGLFRDDQRVLRSALRYLEEG